MISYRPEIDGMRAVSVLSVVFYHAGIVGFSGGYVGVDVFFVISGFLITSLLLKDWDTHDYSLANFWTRRARRILPALLTVLLLSAIYAWFFLPPLPLVKMGDQLIASIFFAANFWMSGAVNYFSPEATHSPLSHIWSLAVEEQFYLLFPLFLVLTLRSGRKLTLALLSALLVFSLLFAQWSGNLKLTAPYIEDNFLWYAPSAFADFYLPTGRAWELMVGGVLAFTPTALKKLPSSLQDTLAAIGLLLICAAVVLFDADTPTPGFQTLVPVLGAALIILGAHSDGKTYALLTWKPLVFIGLISYSLYLIHQPILGFYRSATYEETIQFGTAALLIAASIFLSYVSWRYIEQPCRNPKRLPKHYLYPGLGLLAVLCLGIGVAGKITAGPRMKNMSAQDRYFLSLDHQELGEYVGKRFGKSQGPFDLDKPTLKILVAGDSHGQDFTNVIGEMAKLNQAQLRAITFDNSCAHYFTPTMEITSLNKTWSLDHEEELCARQIQSFLNSDNTKTADIVFIAQQWREDGAQAVGVLLEQLQDINVHNVVIVSKKRFGKIRPENYLNTSLEQLQAYTHTPSDTLVRINDTLAQKAGKGFLDLNQVICNPDGTCPIFTPQGRLISYDGGHLTQDGAIYIGEKLSSSDNFWSLFSTLPQAGRE